jgi:hypothetical protein
MEMFTATGSPGIATTTTTSSSTTPTKQSGKGAGKRLQKGKQMQRQKQKSSKTTPCNKSQPTLDESCGYLFICSNRTQQECLDKQLFGLPVSTLASGLRR